LNVRQLEGITILALCVTAVLWVAATGSVPASQEIIRLFLLATLFLVIKVLFIKDMPSPTASGAIVMAIGIFINGAIGAFPLLNNLGRSLTLILLLLFLFIAASYLVDLVQGRAFGTHFTNPVGRFAVGTWIAGTSVCGVALCQRLPEWKPLVQVMVLGNLGLWLYFVYRTMRSFIQFFDDESWRKVHGVLFLSTVSTQSLVIVWKAAFGESSIYRIVAPWVILLGVVFYFVSFFLIVRRYASEGADIDLDKGWFNTNCITHGAMSITGLASIVSDVVPPNLVLLVWLWAITWFVIVEFVEIARAMKRTKLYGLAEGLLIYDPTQWSRNFTFGMLYAFTLNFDLAGSAAAGSIFLPLHEAILRYFAWIVLLLLLVEIFVFFRDRLDPGVSAIK
jgi:hypothetical protein